MIGKREKHVVGNRLGREMTRMVVQWYLNMREKLGRQTQQVRPLKCEKAEKAKKRKKRKSGKSGISSVSSMWMQSKATNASDKVQEHPKGVTDTC